ncbi:MAG: DUF3846 domain-containing protein [Eubacteriales bacterium]|nr:DUF3846 domain-containing protein [Eubacteriales bacterium]
MKKRIVVIRPMEVPEVQYFDDKKDSLNDIVEGYLEAIYPFQAPHRALCLFVNEEGKLLHLPPNRVLTDQDGRVYDILQGNMCVVAHDSEGEMRDLTDEEVEAVFKRFGKREMFVLDPDR